MNPKSMNADLPSLGPYELLERLGQGGMGVVWRALDPRTGRRVALKTVRVPHAGLISGIRRELRALAQLHHPGIVRILDEGVTPEGLPWYAMELLEGVSLRAWRAPAPDTASLAPSTREENAAPSPTTQDLACTLELADAPTGLQARPTASSILPIPEALELTRRLCFALSYLHGEGLVHRDLKPDNILVRPAGQPVIVDFGLVSRSAAEQGREALEVAGLVAGTLAYMAPEQGRGERVDARADLYSLGCILYELLTGRPPFSASTASRLLSLHSEERPEPPSRLDPRIPAQLDALVLRLLEKAPRDRYGYADDVAAALAGLGASSEPPSSAPPAKPYLYRPLFSGRAEVLEPLLQRIQALGSGAGGLCLIGGESGVGKTRLLVELSRLASERRLRVLTGECPWPGGGAARGAAPLQAFRKFLQSIADRCRERGARETEALLSGRGRILEAYEPSLLGLPGLELHAPPAEIPPREARLRLRHALIETLAAEVRRNGALLLLLDDLHWADQLSLDVLEALNRTEALASLPLLVLGVYRTEEGGEPIDRLARSPGLLSWTLERLGGPELERIVADMLGLRSPPRAFSSFLLSQSAGNPFFVAEYLRAMIGGGFLYRDSAGHWQVVESKEPRTAEQIYASLPLPKSLLELVSSRLLRLSAEALELVEAFCVLGREADPALASCVAGLDEAKARAALSESIARQILEPAEGAALRFPHDQLRQVAYSRLPDERRRALHHAAALALETTPEEQGSAWHAALGLHWEQAGRPDLARPHDLAAAQAALARYDHAEAERLYRDYLRLTEAPSPESVGARLALAEKALFLAGRNEPAREMAEQALAEARKLQDPGLQAASLWTLGGIHLQLGRREQAWKEHELALELFRQAGDRRGEGAVLNSLAWNSIRQSRWDEAIRLGEQALGLFQALGDRGGEARTLHTLAEVRRSQSHYEQALRLCERAVELTRGAGDRNGEAANLSLLGTLLGHLGRVEEQRPLYERHLALCRELGNRGAEGNSLMNLGVWHHGRGRLAEARQFYEGALLIHREVGDPRSEGLTRMNLGELHRLEGRPEQAQLCFERALPLLQATGAQISEGIALGNLGKLLLREGRPAEARPWLERAVALFQEARHPRLEGMSLGLLANLELLAEADEHELQKPLARLERAEAILASSGDRRELLSILCVRGHLEIALGRSGQPALQRARELAATLHLDAEQSQAMAQLQRAEQAFEHDELHRLFRGQLVEDLSPGLRRWLTEQKRP